MSDIEKIVSNFISLALDVESENFTDGRLQRWNNMLKELEALIQEQVEQAKKYQAFQLVDIWEESMRIPIFAPPSKVIFFEELLKLTGMTWEDYAEYQNKKIKELKNE